MKKQHCFDHLQSDLIDTIFSILSSSIFFFYNVLFNKFIFVNYESFRITNIYNKWRHGINKKEYDYENYI